MGTKIAVFVVLFLGSLCAWAKDIHTPLYGTWKPVGKSEINLFDGSIHITPVKKRTNGFYTLIYDLQKHGLTCFYMADPKVYLCMPVMLNKVPISKEDRIDEIMDGGLIESSMYVKIKVDKKNLKIDIAPLSTECTDPQKCVYKSLPPYQKEKR